MLLLHPRIYLDATGACTDALLIRDGRVVAIGKEAKAAVGDSSAVGEPVHKPQGACLFPALGEAHIHLWGLGLRGGSVDLRGMDVDAIIEALKDAQPQTDGWIFGTNWDEHNFSAHQDLSRERLDELFPDNPLCLRRVDGHAFWVNTAALQRCRFHQNYQPGDGGFAEVDAQGQLTGKLVDLAMEPVIDALPQPDIEEDREVFLKTCQTLRDQGIAFCTLAFCPVDRLDMLKELSADQKIPLHVDVLVDGMDPDLDEVLSEGPFHGENLRIGGVKVFADGAMGSAGAHLLTPYRTGGRGMRIHPEGFLARRIPELMQQGWQVAVHAIGDAAAREVLDAFENVPSELRKKLRPRLEHAQIVDPRDSPRFDELDVIASIQPIHLRSDAPWAARRLHPEQLQNLFPWRSLLPATLCAGSDYPIDDLNPWHGISTAMTRKGSDGVAFRPEDALNLSEILAAYTTGAAFAAHCEDDFGTLHPGARAEFAILAVDLFEATPEEIWELQVKSRASPTDPHRS